MKCLHIVKAPSKLSWLKLFYVLFLWKDSGHKISEINPFEVNALLSLAFLKGYRELISSYSKTLMYINRLKMSLIDETQKSKFAIWRTRLL